MSIRIEAIRLQSSVTTHPDFGGGLFYVEAGHAFESDDYAAHNRLHPADIDAEDISAVQDAASRLNPGEWLLVDHTVITA